VQGTGFNFYIVGLFATLRAVPHVLMQHDAKLSSAHRSAIEAWWKQTKNLKEHPEFHLIIRSRNQILKEGSFESYASSWEGTSEPGVVHYEIVHYVDGERHDAEIDVRAALDWMERQLIKIESDLPPRTEATEASEQDVTDDELMRLAQKGIPPQRIAGSTSSPRIEEGAVISFSRRPQPWLDGDILAIFHEPYGRTTFTAIEHERFCFTWVQADRPSFEIELEEVDDCRYRIIPVN
jgi:hypothetical protein